MFLSLVVSVLLLFVTSLKMASSGRGGLRLNQPPRAPTLIAVGLTVAFIALAYNYWAVSIIKRKLSAENTELRDAVAKLKVIPAICVPLASVRVSSRFAESRGLGLRNY